MSNNLAYQEERRTELIGGKTVMMSPASTNHTFVPVTSTIFSRIICVGNQLGNSFAASLRIWKFSWRIFSTVRFEQLKNATVALQL